MEITFNYNRAESIKALADAYSGRFQLSPEEYEQKAKDWQVVGLMLGNDLIGAVCIKESEGHIGIRKEFRGKWNIVRNLNNLCRIFEVTKTIVLNENKKSMQLLERCGWKRTGKNYQGVVYVLQ